MLKPLLKPLMPNLLVSTWAKKYHDRNPATLGGVLFVVLLTLLILIGILVWRFESAQHQQREIETVQQQLHIITTALKSRIFSSIYKVASVKSLVAMNPDLTQDDFARAMEVQFRDQDDLRNIGLARAMILQFMYPIEGNEAAIGLDYSTLPDQIGAVKLALELNQIVLAGPLNLVQGGQGIIARIPIQTTDPESQQDDFWGFASVVMNSEAIFTGAGITEDHPVLRIAMRGRDGMGTQGEVFFGDPEIFDQAPITRSIELPYGSWYLAAIPVTGWTAYSALTAPLMWIYLLVALIILTFAAISVVLMARHRQSVEALKKERNLFAEGPVFTMEWSPEQNGNWPIKHVSSNITTILGYCPAEMLQPDFYYTDLIHPDDLERVINRLKHHIEHRIDRYEESYRLKTKTGHYLWIYDFTLLGRNAAGDLIDIRSYMYDQSARKQAEEALRIAQKQLEQTAYDLTENIPVGTYTMVQPADGGMARFAFMSSRFLDLLGLDRELAASDALKAFACVLHPDDFDAWVALNAQTFQEKKPFFGETRVIVNGEIRWVTAESTPRTLPDGVTVWEGVLTDITDRKQAERALHESLQRFNDLVAYMSVGVYVFWHRANGEMDFEYVSDGWCAMNQVRREDVLANPRLAWDVIHPDDIDHFTQLNQQVVRERTRFTWEGRIIVGGDVRFVLIESSPVFFDNGDSRWFGIEQDISERKHAEAILHATNMALGTEVAERRIIQEQLKIKTDMLEKLSMQDGLTHIPNRRHFDERAQLEWKRSARTGLPLALVMIDIDQFKLYNDHYGHGAGDDCLRQVAQTLMHCCDRPLDLVARYGGEEFVALLPETDTDGALHLAEQMRLAVERLAIPHAYSSVAKIVTLSLGVAVHSSNRVKTDLAQLQKCADQALYAAKRQGRNRVQEDML